MKMTKHSLILLTLMAGVMTSCSTREVMYLDSNSTATVRLRETVKAVKVWVKNSSGETVSGVADLPEGGYYRATLK
jgi:hypothetical protein